VTRVARRRNGVAACPDPLDTPTAREVVERVVLPPAVLSPQREEELTPRDREIRRELTKIFTQHGFACFRMIDLASELHCSLRTLYRFGSTREELFLAVIDRIAATYGRAAVEAVTPDMTALEGIVAYLRVGNDMVHLFQGQLGVDIAATPQAAARTDVYVAHGVNVVHALLDFAVERGEIEPLNTGALARMLAAAARDFTRRDALRLLDASPQDAANDVIEVILEALRR